MKKIIDSKQVLLSFVPIFGFVVYMLKKFYESVATKNQNKWVKSGLSVFFGMLAFILIYGTFAIICNITHFNVLEYEWLLYSVMYISFVIWNIVFFLSYNRLTTSRD